MLQFILFYYLVAMETKLIIRLPWKQNLEIKPPLIGLLFTLENLARRGFFIEPEPVRRVVVKATAVLAALHF